MMNKIFNFFRKLFTKDNEDIIVKKKLNYNIISGTRTFDTYFINHKDVLIYLERALSAEDDEDYRMVNSFIPIKNSTIKTITYNEFFNDSIDIDKINIYYNTVIYKNKILKDKLLTLEEVTFKHRVITTVINVTDKLISDLEKI